MSSRDLLYYVGVHHKAGTVWMTQVHRAIGQRLGLPVSQLVEPPGSGVPTDFKQIVVDTTGLEPTLRMIRRQRRGILFDHHSSFAEVPMRVPTMRGVHIVRDPRDVLISATHYHLRARERWLHLPRPRFGGGTYQEAIRSAGTFREALLFELRHRTRKVIRGMTSFPPFPRVPTITYEALIADDALSTFERMFSSLGFSGPTLEVALNCAIDNSIALNPARQQSGHIRSGKPEQWREVFDQGLGQRFAAEEGDALIALGYERDDSWLSALPAVRGGLDDAVPDSDGSSLPVS